MMAITVPIIGIVAKASLNTLGSVMNISDGPESGLTPTEKAAGNIINPARMAMSESMTTMLTADFMRLALREK